MGNSKKIILGLFFTLFIFFATFSKAYAFSCSSNGTGGGNFNVAATWTACNSTTPQTSDSITINSGDTVTLVATTTVAGITINNTGVLAANTRALTDTGGYTNNGSQTGTTSTMTLSGSSGVIDGTGTYVPTGVVTVSNGAKTVASSSHLSFDKITVTGVTLTNNSTLGLTIITALSGTGQVIQGTSSVLNINGTSTITALDASASSNEVHYTSTGANQTIKVPTSSYYHLFIDKLGRVGTLTGATIINGNLSVTAGTLADGGFQITGNATGNFTLASGTTLTLGTTTTATSFPTSFTNAHIVLNTTSIVNYNSNLAQAISNIPTYGNLTTTATASVTKTAAGAITVNGTFTNGNNNIFADGGFIITLKSGSIMTGTHTGTGKILFSGGSAVHSVSGTGSYNNVELDDSNGVSQSVATTINGTLTIISGTWTASNTLTVTGNTSINGTLSITSTAGTKTLGNIIINSGGSISFSAAEAVAVNGNLTVNSTGTILGTTGIWTFQKAGGGTIGGTASLLTILGNTTFATQYSINYPITVNTFTVNTGVNETNTSTITVNTSLAGAGTLTQGAGTILNLGGTSGITTLDASANLNEVHYTSTSANQTLKAATYYHLFVEKNGRTGTVSTTTNVLGNLSVTSGSTLALGASVLTVTGTTDIFGILSDTNNSGLASFGGLVTIHSGGSWAGNQGEACNFNFSNGFVFNGTSFTTGDGIYTFKDNNQSITGSGVITLGNLVVTGISLTNNLTSPLTIQTALLGTGEFIQGANATLYIGGTSAITTLTASASGNSVIYNGTTTQIVKAATYSKLDVSQNTSKDGAYIDADNSGTVSVGDTRVSIGVAVFSGFGYVRGSIVAIADTDIGTSIVLPIGVNNLKKTGAAATTFVYGADGAYTDIDSSGTVSVGDIRVAIGSIIANGFGKAIGSTVLVGDTDIGTIIVLPIGTNLKKTGIANSLFVYTTDGAYVDTDSSGTVTAGDIRISVGDAVFSGLGYNHGSTVLTGDTDIGTVIILPVNALKKTGSGVSVFVYGTDGAYVDTDLSGTVSVGDVRVAVGNTVANGSDYIAGSTVGAPIVSAGDTDMGTSIVFPTGGNNLKKTGAGGTLFVYDTINISGVTTVNATLILGGTKLYTAANKIIIGPGAVLSRTLGFVVGNLQKHINTGASSLAFEIGLGNSYTPLTLTFGNVSSAGDVTASTTPTDDPDISNSPIDPAKSVNRHWSLINSGLIFGSYDIVLNFASTDIDTGVSPSNMIIAKKNTGVWNALSASCTAISCTATGLTSMSEFQIGVEQPGFQSGSSGGSSSSSVSPLELLETLFPPIEPLTSLLQPLLPQIPAPSGASPLFDILASPLFPNLGSANNAILFPVVVIAFLGGSFIGAGFLAGFRSRSKHVSLRVSRRRHIV